MDKAVCDIVIPVWNQYELTKNCLESVYKNTEAPFRVIFIDNASLEETRSFLDRFLNTHENATLISNSENVGVTKAFNQGILASSADFVCILNNDTVVTPGWLSQMIDVANSNTSVGIVNPASNNMGEPLKEPALACEYSKKLLRFKGQYEELAGAIGFCMLIKRSLIERIGLFDERFSPANFEDTDYSRRAIEAGFLCVRAKAAYVHHIQGSSTRIFKGIDEVFERNKKLFEDKWGRTLRILYLAGSSGLNEESLMADARRGNYVWVFKYKQNKFDLAKHSNIIYFNIIKPIFWPYSILKILLRNKRFDKIYARRSFMLCLLSYLKFIHKAEVIYLK